MCEREKKKREGVKKENERSRQVVVWVDGRLVSGNGIENDIRMGQMGHCGKDSRRGKEKKEKRDAGRWPCVCGVLTVSIFPFTIG